MRLRGYSPDIFTYVRCGVDDLRFLPELKNVNSVRLDVHTYTVKFAVMGVTLLVKNIVKKIVVPIIKNNLVICDTPKHISIHVPSARCVWARQHPNGQLDIYVNGAQVNNNGLGISIIGAHTTGRPIWYP